MMKFLFLCLLLANGALFAYQQGYLDSLVSDGHEPARATRQFNVDKIKLMAVGASDGASTAATAPAIAPLTEPAPVIEVVPAAAPALAQAPLEKKPALLACTEIGNFNEVDAVRFEKQLTPLALGPRLSRRAMEEVFSHIVFIPPQGSKENADKKIGELRRLGVSDFFVIKDDAKMQWGISLGVYKTQAAAKARLADLNGKGVQTARIGNYSVSPNKIAFQLRDLEVTTKDALVKIKTDFPQQEIRTCA